MRLLAVARTHRLTAETDDFESLRPHTSWTHWPPRPKLTASGARVTPHTLLPCDRSPARSWQLLVPHPIAEKSELQPAAPNLERTHKDRSSYCKLTKPRAWRTELSLPRAEARRILIGPHSSHFRDSCTSASTNAKDEPCFRIVSQKLFLLRPPLVTSMCNGVEISTARAKR